VSCVYPTPPWQTQPSYETASLLGVAGSSACVAAATAGGGRVVPDISLNADPATSVGVVANVAFGSGTQYAYGGTSVAAPEMAAMWAVVLSACAKSSTCATATGAKSYRLGNAAPILWKLYQTQATYNSTIYDVTFGNNGVVPCTFTSSCAGAATPAPGYSAGAGWDPVTGLGVPFARNLIKAVAGD
jgi:subtilase family serine protease